MAELKDFECLRCGTCCRSILQISNGIKRGIPLTEKEVRQFPSETVSPRLAVGSTRPETVILWQLNTNFCPNINSINQCQTYEKRPLICKSFPIVASAISNRCKVFSYRKVGFSYSEPYRMKSQLEASDKLSAYIKNRIKKHCLKGFKMWEYDLETNKWVNEQECSLS